MNLSSMAPAGAETPSHRRWRIVWKCGLVAGLVAVVFWLWPRDVTLEELLISIRLGGPVPFFVAMAVLPAFGVPVTPFFLLAGAAFGIWTSLIGSAAALAVQYWLTYWLAQKYLHKLLEKLVRKAGYKIPSFKRAHSWKFTLAVKLTPGPPPAIKNYLFGLAGVPFRMFFWICWPISLVYAVGIILLGDSFFDKDYWKMGLALGLVGIVLLGLKLFRDRVARERMEAE